MNDLEKFDYINRLFDFYKNLLTDKQKLIMQKYYEFNLSLKEISDELQISRSAVLDTIEHATKKLYEYEKSLSLYKRSERLITKINSLNISEKEKQELIDEVIYGI